MEKQITEQRDAVENVRTMINDLDYLLKLSSNL